MLSYYTIRRKADGAIICSGYTNTPVAEIESPAGCEVLPYRVPGDVAKVAKDGRQILRPGIAARPVQRPGRSGA